MSYRRYINNALKPPFIGQPPAVRLRVKTMLISRQGALAHGWLVYVLVTSQTPSLSAGRGCDNGFRHTKCALSACMERINKNTHSDLRLIFVKDK